MCFLIFPFLTHPKSGNWLSRALEASKMNSDGANGHISSVYYPRIVLWRFQDLKNFFKFSCLIYHGWHRTICREDITIVCLTVSWQDMFIYFVCRWTLMDIMQRRKTPNLLQFNLTWSFVSLKRMKLVIEWIMLFYEGLICQRRFLN